MSDTVKKESTRKKSASGTAEKAEKATKATVEETKTVKTTAKKTAASKKTKVEETAEIEVEKPTKSKKTATKKKLSRLKKQLAAENQKMPILMQLTRKKLKQKQLRNQLKLKQMMPTSKLLHRKENTPSAKQPQRMCRKLKASNLPNL
jgi:hypothetical protein